MAGLLTLAPAHLWAAAVHLELERAEDTETVCPDANTFRSGLASRVGQEPLRDDAKGRLRVKFARRGEQFTAYIVLTDELGGVALDRELVASTCEGVASAATVVISIALGETLAVPQRTTKKESLAAEDLSPVPESRAPVNAGEKKIPPTSYGLGFALFSGVLPQTAPGVEAGMRFDLTRIASADLILDLLPEQVTDKGQHAMSLLGLQGGSCFASSGRVRIGGCVRAGLGLLSSVSRVANVANPGNRPFLHLSAGPDVRVRLAGPLELHAGVDALLPLTPYELASDCNGIEFRQSRLAFGTRMGVRATFF